MVNIDLSNLDDLDEAQCILVEYGVVCLWIKHMDLSHIKFDELVASSYWTGSSMVSPTDTVIAKYNSLNECIHSYLAINFTCKMFPTPKEMFVYILGK